MKKAQLYVLLQRVSDIRDRIFSQYSWEAKIEDGYTQKAFAAKRRKPTIIITKEL